MPVEDDVLVIGGGLAGATASLAAARRGARVRVVSAAESTLQQASGLVDVLGYTPAGDGPLVDPFSAIEDLPDGHPYSRVGESAVRDGLALFDEAIEGYRGAGTDRNALVPTVGGTVKPTARYPEAVTAGLASDGRSALLVGFQRLPDFDAPLAAAHLEAAGVPFDVRGITAEFPVDVRDDAGVTRYARLLDRDEEEVRMRLASAIEPHLDGEQRVGLPAVLGLDDHEGVIESLETALGVAVFEIPPGPPSLPGMRLAAALKAALDDAGVRVTTGDPIVDYGSDDGRVRAAIADRNGARVPYHAAEFVLATGGLVGKGIEAGRDAVREPVFGCHVPHPADREDWSAPGAFGEHHFARFGVEIDGQSRPRTPDGTPEFENLRAAGAVIGGADFAAEKSGSGISLATGYAAGSMAGELA